MQLGDWCADRFYRVGDSDVEIRESYIRQQGGDTTITLFDGTDVIQSKLVNPQGKLLFTMLGTKGSGKFILEKNGDEGVESVEHGDSADLERVALLGDIIASEKSDGTPVPLKDIIAMYALNNTPAEVIIDHNER